MNKYQLVQQNLCLEVRMLCNLLRTKLLLIEDYKHFGISSKHLEKIKSEVLKIYWEI